VVSHGPTGTDAVDAISATDVWAVGGSAIWNLNGTSWTEVTTVSGQLSATSGSSANDIFAAGGTLVEQWNGMSWSVVTSASSVELTGVTTLSNGTAVAVGDGGIESNATTAAPAVSISKPASSVSGVVPNVVIVPPTVATTNAVVMGTHETPSSTLGTNKNALTS